MHGNKEYCEETTIGVVYIGIGMVSNNKYGTGDFDALCSSKLTARCSNCHTFAVVCTIEL